MGSLPWFKVYTEVRVDRKLAHLTLAERGVWLNLLAYASEQEHEKRGAFDASDHYALAMECAEGDEDILASTLVKLQRSKHLIGVTDHEGWLAFRTYATRQARKPSDAPEATRERQRRSRASRRSNAMSRDVTRDGHEKRNVTRLEERREKREEEETLSLSGNVVNTSADADAPARAASAAAATEDHNDWTELEARRLAKRIAGRLRLTNPDIEALMAVLRQHRYAPAWLEAEAATCVEWYSAKKRKIDLRLFNNWLAKAEQRHREAALQEASLSNGHQHHTTTTATTTTGITGTDGITSSPDPGDALYQFNVERARAKLVQ